VVNFSASLNFHQIYSFPSDKFVTRKWEQSMNSDSADEGGAGLEKLPPNGAPEGRVSGIGRHPASAAGDASAGFWADSGNDWDVWAEALSGR
jgi:hypothetical protein